MTEDMLKCLCFAINELTISENAAHTIHEIIFRLKDTVNIVSALLVEKNVKNDNLEIKNRYNISENFTRAYKRGVGINVIGRILYSEEFAVVRKGENEDDCKDICVDREFETAVVMRIAVSGRAVGFLSLYFAERLEITDQLRQFLMTITKLCAEAISKERQHHLMTKMRAVDPNTGLLYYNHFHQRLREEFNKSKRANMPLSVAIIDMDNYKRVTGVYGTETAHELYKELADELRACLRGVDVIGRYGTDEFIIFLPNTPLEGAEVILNRFIEQIECKKFTDYKLCTSFYMGTATMQQNDTLEQFLNNVQSAIYDAKLKGKKIVKCGER
ncbi:MAG: GGDEF domain-containing protein [Candidatus Magnetominusculus sp. LBB02]|nr:GGDEF domain-containing protein [Candidatus Magnetominusculus sp. LBB02]